MRIPGSLAKPVFALLVTLAMPALTGCGKEKAKPEHDTRQGRVAAINKDTGVMEMWVYAPKLQKEMRVQGRLDPNVEILINGATATLDDVQIDDKVNVVVRMVKKDGERSFIATKVDVIRPVAETATAPTP